MYVCGGGEGGRKQGGRKQKRNQKEKKIQALEEKQHYPDSLKKQVNSAELNRHKFHVSVTVIIIISLLL